MILLFLHYRLFGEPSAPVSSPASTPVADTTLAILPHLLDCHLHHPTTYLHDALISLRIELVKKEPEDGSLEGSMSLGGTL